MTTTTTQPTAEQVQEMREFLARVMRFPLTDIRITGDPATDRHADLVKSHTATETQGIRTTTTEKLCTVTAIEIDSILAGDIDRLPDGSPDLARGAAMFSQYLAERATLYP